MQYGTIIDETDEGQTITYIRGGKEMAEKRRIIIEQKRVANQLEEVAEYHAFSKRFHADKSMLKPKLEIEGKDKWSGGKAEYYYVVLSYTQVGGESFVI